MVYALAMSNYRWKVALQGFDCLPLLYGASQEQLTHQLGVTAHIKYKC